MSKLALSLFFLTAMVLSVFGQTEDGRIAIETCVVTPFAKQGEPLKVTVSYNAKQFGSTITDYAFDFLVDGKVVQRYTQEQWGSITYTTVRKDIQLPLPQGIALGQHRCELVVKRGELVDKTMTSHFRVYKDVLPRQKYLLEHFTATWCPNCPYAVNAMEDVKLYYDDVAWVSIHRFDGYAVSGSERLAQINSLSGYPSIYPDRRYIQEVNGYRLGAYRGSENPSQEVADELHRRIVNTPIPVLTSIDIAPIYNPESRQLDITVSLQSVEDFETTFGTSALTVVLIEDSIPNASNNKLRYIVSAADGDDIQWNTNRFEKMYSLTLPEKCNAKHVKVVAFVGRKVQGANVPQSSERFVTNAEMVPVQIKTTTRINTVQQATEPALYFDMQGRVSRTPKQGVNIIRYGNGNAQKRWVK